MTDPIAAPVSSHPTHRGLAIRAVDVRAGRVPGINPVPVSERHPDSEAPAHYADAIDEVTQLNWMDMPTVEFLPGTSPRYDLVQPLSAATWGEIKSAHKLGYRAGEWYFIPEDAVVLPPVWDPSADAAATKPDPDDYRAALDALSKAAGITPEALRDGLQAITEMGEVVPQLAGLVAQGKQYEGLLTPESLRREIADAVVAEIKSGRLRLSIEVRP